MVEYIISNSHELKNYRENSYNFKGCKIIIDTKIISIIKDIHFSNPIEFKFNNTSENLKIKAVIFSEEVLIGDLEPLESRIGLKFEGCEFRKEFTYDDREKANIFDIVTFNNCSFLGNTTFDGINSDQLNFSQSPKSGCTFENNVWFKNVKANISFIKANFNGIMNFEDLLADTSIRISSGIISGNIRINSHFSKIEIEGPIVKRIDGIIPKIDIFSKNKNKTSTIKITKIKDLDELIISGEDESELKSVEIDKYYMSGGFQGIFLLYNLDIGNFEYKSSTITPKISINNVKFDYLKFDDVNLGDAIFNNSIIKKLKIIGVVLDECKFNGCELPNSIEELEDKGIMKDYYRQLKFSMDKNGNHTEANKFYAKEMEFHMKSLKIDSRSTGLKLIAELYREGFDGEKSKKTSEKAPLIFSYIVNDFGNNWILAFKWLITLALFSTLIDAGSTLMGIKEYWGIATFFGTSNDFIGDLAFLTLIILGILGILKFESKKEIKINFLDNFFSKFGNTIMFFFIVFLLITISSGDLIDSFKTFGNLLNPLYFLDSGRTYNSIEIIGFTIYKSVYAIILWHLITAAKRTTKR